jgi:ATP-dependent helicase/nuclease subunit A
MSDKRTDGRRAPDLLTAHWETDRAARRDAQTEFTRPFLLEAGAGTGKTAALTARVICWCLGPGWEKSSCRLAEKSALQRNAGPLADSSVAGDVVDRVLAVTFTEAAAAEMSTRICAALRQLGRGENPVGIFPDVIDSRDPAVQRRAHALLAAQDRLKISTLHAFCRRLLAEHPLEAGLHPQLTIDADTTLIEEVVHELLERELPAAYDRGDRDLLALAAGGRGPHAIQEALVGLAQKAIPPAVFETSPFDASLTAEIRKTLRTHLETFWQTGGARLDCGRTSSATVQMLREIEALISAKQQACETDAAGSPPAEAPTHRLAQSCAAIAATLSDKGLARLAAWSKGRFNKSEQKATAACTLADLGGAAGAIHRDLKQLAAMEPETLDTARRALFYLYSRTHATLRARGIMSFDSLVKHTVWLLGADPLLCARLSGFLDQILVDEFQDTDRYQCAMLERLALEPAPDARPGLFLVGDPKQSIYGWRDADLEAYETFKEKLLATGGRVRALSVNFRSAPPILAEVDRVLAPIMVAERGLQPPFQPLDPCPEKATAPGFAHPPRCAVEYWVSWDTDPQQEKPFAKTPTARATALEAAALAQDIVELAAAGVSYGAIGVLFRSTGDLDHYVEALRRRGVPYTVSRDRNYYRRREIIDAAALVRCVVDPNDHLALLTVLRAPCVGVPDAALIPLWAQGLPALATRLYGHDETQLAQIHTLIRTARQALPAAVDGLERVAGWHHNLAAALEHLALLREIFHTQPADVFCESLRRLFWLEPTEGCRHLGRYRLANLERFFFELTESLDRTDGNIHSLLRFLRTAIAEQREAAEASPPGTAQDAVQIMTVHGAKGLDFAHVYLVQTHKTGRPDRLEHTDFWQDDTSTEYTLFGLPTWGYRRVVEKKQKIRSRELIRTLYVALTRAQDRLVILGKWPAQTPTRKHPDPLRARSYMDLLAHRKAALPALLERAQKDPHAAFTDAQNVRWRFLPTPTATAVQARARKDTGSAAALYDPKPLIALMEAASARMQRPRSRKVSALAHPDTAFAPADSAPAQETRRERTSKTEIDPAHQRALGDTLQRPTAILVGIAVHAALENWDFGAPPKQQLARQRDCTARRIALLAETDHLRQKATLETHSLLERIAQGPLLAKLSALAPHILFRELDVIAPPHLCAHSGTEAPSLHPNRDAESPLRLGVRPLENGPPGNEPRKDEPLGYLAGTVDLVYQDPDHKGIVVADYKTDRVGRSEESAALAHRYTPQLHCYGEILRQALNLEAAPRLELWFLRAAAIHVLEPRKN